MELHIFGICKDILFSSFCNTFSHENIIYNDSASDIIHTIYIYDSLISSLDSISSPATDSVLFIPSSSVNQNDVDFFSNISKRGISYIYCKKISELDILNHLAALSLDSVPILSAQYELALLKQYIQTLQDGHHNRIRDLMQVITDTFCTKIKVENVGNENGDLDQDISLLGNNPQSVRIVATLSGHPIYYGRVPKADLGVCIVAPIYRFNDVVEFLLIGNHSEKLSEIDSAAIRATISALEIEYEMRRSVFSVVNNSRNNLMDSITISGKLSASTIYDWAKLLGFKSNKLYAVIYLDFASDSNTKDTGKNVYNEILKFMVHYYHPEDYYFIRSSEECLYMIGQYPTVSNVDVQRKAYAMSEQLINSLLQKKGLVKVIYIGIGSTQADIDSIPQSYRDSLEAAQMARTSNKSIVSYKKLGILRLLNNISESDSINNYISPFIIQLKEYDEKYNSNLIDTISAYYAANCNSAQAAKALFIHYKTMLSRLNRIRQITNIDYNDSQIRLDAEIGLRILHMLQPTV